MTYNKLILNVSCNDSLSFTLCITGKNTELVEIKYFNILLHWQENAQFLNEQQYKEKKDGVTLEQ